MCMPRPLLSRALLSARLAYFCENVAPTSSHCRRPHRRAAQRVDAGPGGGVRGTPRLPPPPTPLERPPCTRGGPPLWILSTQSWILRVGECVLSAQCQHVEAMCGADADDARAPGHRAPAAQPPQSRRAPRGSRSSCCRRATGKARCTDARGICTTSAAPRAASGAAGTTRAATGAAGSGAD